METSIYRYSVIGTILKETLNSNKGLFDRNWSKKILKEFDIISNKTINELYFNNKKYLLQKEQIITGKEVRYNVVDDIGNFIIKDTSIDLDFYKIKLDNIKIVTVSQEGICKKKKDLLKE